MRLYLQPGAALAQRTAAESPADRYTFDPAAPTPALGGPSLSLRPTRVDNRKLEARADVLAYTSEPLPADLDVIGQVTAELWVSSDAASTDLFVRLCEVNERGESHNVCDGLLRVRFAELPEPVHGAQRVVVSLWPTAQRFVAGRRLRVLISGGAYPRWAVNPGTLSPLAGPARRVRQTQSIHHDALHASAIVLPVVPTSARAAACG